MFVRAFARLAVSVGLLAAGVMPTFAQQPVVDTSAPLRVRMLEHGRGLWDRGSVREAREFFEVAAEDGLGDAAHAMALSYDLETLRQRRLPISLADDTSRRRWAERAAALGRPVPDAVVSIPSSAPVRASTGVSAAVLPSATPSPDAPLAISAGTYSTHVMPGCGEPFQSVMLTITGRTVAFEHVFKGVPYGWRGTVEPDGTITASVEGSSALKATGRFDQKSVDLIYPQCGSTPIDMRIRWLVR